MSLFRRKELRNDDRQNAPSLKCLNKLKVHIREEFKVSEGAR